MQPEALALFGIPFDAPRRRSRADAWQDLKQGLDFVAHNLPRAHQLLVRVNPYPRPWRHLDVVGHEDVRLSAWYAQGEPGGPAVLFAPGTFQTKDDTPRKRRAIDLWRRLGASVLIMDLRGFGGSSAHLGSAGHLESRDLLRAADRLRAESGAKRVTLWGESLGGATALLSAALPEGRQRYDRVLAWSPFADLVKASRVASPQHAVGQTTLGRTYRWLLRRRTDAPDFDAYLAMAAQELGISRYQLALEASPLTRVHDIQLPTDVFHAEDDDVVPVAHARWLQEARAPNLRVNVVPRGGHLDFDRVAPVWYGQVTEALLRPSTS